MGKELIHKNSVKVEMEVTGWRYVPSITVQ